MKKQGQNGNRLLVILTIILILLLGLCAFFLLPSLRSRPVESPSSSRVQPTLPIPSSSKPRSVPSAVQPTEAAAPAISNEARPTEIVWPTVTAQDDREDLGVPFTIQGVILVNRRHPVNQNYIPPTRNINGAILQPEAMEAYLEMQAAAGEEGFHLFFRSGYRDFGYQVMLRRQYLRSDPGGEDSVDRYSAPPGASEHQTGLAVDIDDGSGLSDTFDQTPMGKWLHENAYRYGFILRFPEGKEGITGYTYEPWHFRYVGRTLAADFGPCNTLTLEEYLGAEPAPAPHFREEENSSPTQ